MPVVDQEDLSDTICIVGTGVAGCVVANRLFHLASKNKKLLLVERGGDPSAHANVQDLRRFPRALDHHATFDDTTLQTGLAQRYIAVVTASAVGGGSVVNAGTFVLGAKEDYDFLPREQVQRAVDEIVAKHDPKPADFVDLVQGSPAQAFCDGLEEQANVPMKNKPALWLDDDGIYQQLVSTGKYTRTEIYRNSVCNTYLEEILDDPRVTLIKNANVTRILLNENKQAVGIEYKVDSKIFGWTYSSSTYTLTGFCQVVVCAGAIETPRLLLTSGIGPKEELECNGIAVQCDNEAIGKELWDHMILALPVEMPQDAPMPDGFPPVGPAGSATMAFKTFDKRRIVYYMANADPVHCIHAEFMLPKFSKSSWSRAAQAFVLQNFRFLIHSRTNTRLGLVCISLLTVESRGSVTLDPSTGKAVVDPGYLQSQQDKEALAQGLDQTLQILRAKRMTVPIPGFSVDASNGGEMASTMAGPSWHYAGTCALGRALDDNFGVKGVSKLAVVDASVFPNVIQANTQAPVMVVAHVAAERIAKGL